MGQSYLFKMIVRFIAVSMCLYGTALADGYTSIIPQGGQTPPITFSGPAALMAQGMTSGYNQQYNPNQPPQALMPGVPAGEYSPQQIGAGPHGGPEKPGLRPTASDQFKPSKKGPDMGPVIKPRPHVGQSQVLYGQATALSGGVLEIHGRKIILAGVSSPPADKICTLQGGIPWNCGRQIKHSLETILKSGPARCELESNNHGYCTILGQPINTAMNNR